MLRQRQWLMFEGSNLSAQIVFMFIIFFNAIQRCAYNNPWQYELSIEIQIQLRQMPMGKRYLALENVAIYTLSRNVCASKVTEISV